MPRRGQVSPFLDDDRRAALGGRLERADSVSRDRYLFYTACTRPRQRLTLIREAATDDGQPREPSPFWDESYALAPITLSLDPAPAPLRALVADRRSPDRAERLRSLSLLSVGDPEGAAALASANGGHASSTGRRAHSAARRYCGPLHRLRSRGTLDVLRHGAGDVLGLLATLVRGTPDRPQVGRCGAGRAAARPDRSPGAEPLLLRALA